jgi:hypothetical protein
VDALVFNIRLLRTAFDIKFNLQDVAPNGPAEVRTRWSMIMKSRFVPWQPKLVFTGHSYYGVSTTTGQLTSQRDVWDAVQDNSYLSVEGIAHVIMQLTTLQIDPNLDQPQYTVLKKVKEYEIRKYEAYLVAETDRPMGKGPAAGDGFQELAGYIFGGNNRSSKMEMTMPVINTNEKIVFPMETKYGTNVDALPQPNDGRIIRRLEEGGVVAVANFSGLPLDYEVTEAERKLRAALLLDGYKPAEGYQLARYNEPFVPPFVRRNEILIRLDDYKEGDNRQ